MQRVNGILGLLVVLCLPAMASAQTIEETAAAGAAEEDSPFSATVSLNQDAFFGFWPMASVGYRVSDLIDVTAYSIIWTTPSFSMGAGEENAGGFGLWTEFGAGVNFRFLDDALSVNPQLGVLNGTLLSGSDGALAAEGLVPNLTIDYDDDYLEAEFYFGYYLGIRGESDARSQFIHYWAYAGLKPLAFGGGPAAGLLTIGAHWEQLRYQGVPADGEAFNFYRWFGPYVQFSLPMDVSLRFAAGGNFDRDDGFPIDFYKVSVAMSF